MRRLASSGLVALALVLTLAASGIAASYSGKDLIGTWNGDVMATMKASGMMDKLPPGFDVSRFTDGIAITLTFEKDGTLVAYNKNFEGEETRAETWELVSAEKNVLTIRNTDQEGEDAIVVITFVDRDRIQIVNQGEEGPPVEFTRATKKAAAEKKE